MKVIFTFFLGWVCSVQILWAQKAVVFEFQKPEFIISKSLYNHIQLVDIRPDINSLEMFNIDTKIKTRIPFKEVVPVLLQASINKTAQNGKLILVLRSYIFDVQLFTCTLKAEIYAVDNEQCYPLSAIDTVLKNSAVFSSQKALFKEGSRLLTNYIAGNLRAKADTSHSIQKYELVKIDSIEKSKLKLYASNQFENGLYSSYKSFSVQVPDVLFTAEKDEKGIIIPYILDENHQSVKANIKGYYAMVYEGKPYIITGKKYFPLQKIDNDFYFQGKIFSNFKDPGLQSLGMFYGAIGGLTVALISKNTPVNFEVKLNYQDGTFVLLNQIK